MFDNFSLYEAGTIDVQIDVKSSALDTSQAAHSISFSLEVIACDVVTDSGACYQYSCESAILAYNEDQLEQFATNYLAQVPSPSSSDDSEASEQGSNE